MQKGTLFMQFYFSKHNVSFTISMSYIIPHSLIRVASQWLAIGGERHEGCHQMRVWHHFLQKPGMPALGIFRKPFSPSKLYGNLFPAIPTADSHHFQVFFRCDIILLPKGNFPHCFSLANCKSGDKKWELVGWGILNPDGKKKSLSLILCILNCTFLYTKTKKIF